MDLSIIIVNYRTYELTKNAIMSVLDSVKTSYEIFIVDNNSQDGSYEKLIQLFIDEINKGTISVIANHINQGFSAANNIAIKKSKGDYILLLNSDTIAKENSIDSSLDYIKNHDDVGAIGPKIFLSDGKLDKAARRSFPNLKNSFYKLFGLSKINKNSKFNNYNLDNLDENGIYEVDSLTGAFMLIKKEVIQEVGLLDEDYFMYGEDIDWCYRIKKAGWKIVYYGKVEIVHFKGSSSKKQKSKLIYEFYRAMYLFYNKHYKSDYSLITRFFVYLGIMVLLIVKLFLNIFKQG